MEMIEDFEAETNKIREEFVKSLWDRHFPQISTI
jgi:hypothetical protein